MNGTTYGTVTANGSMDYAGTTGREMEVAYNEWGAMTKDEARGISSVSYDNLGNPLRVSFSSPRGSYASYVYSASGERLKATHYTSPIIQEGVIEAHSMTDSEDLCDNTESASIGSVTADIVGMTKIEYHGPVIYRNGRIDMVRFPGGYATVNGTAVTFHYYTRDYLGSNRAVVNGSTGAVEQTVAYYPYGSVIADLGTGTSGQPFKFGGKELVTSNGLNEYDFGARQYYPAVPHFTGIDPMCEKYYWLSPYLYCANNPVNAVDPTGEIVICLDEQSQRNISLSLSKDEESFVKFVDGKIDASLLNQCESTSENITALRTVVNSKISFYVATTTEYKTNDITKKFKESSDKGTVGVTLIPGAAEEPSPDNDVHIYVNSKMPAINQTATTAHELYGHGYFYVLRSLGFDVNPFHAKTSIEPSDNQINEAIATNEAIVTIVLTNSKLERQINTVYNQALDNFKMRYK